MSAWITIAKANDIPPGSAKCVEAAERQIAVFNVEGAFYAIDDECPHAGGPLSEGEIEEGVVCCPWHMARFNLRTGEVLDGPASDNIRSYPVRIEGEEIQVELPE